jgi:hypothetical protein
MLIHPTTSGSLRKMEDLRSAFDSRAAYRELAHGSTNAAAVFGEQITICRSAGFGLILLASSGTE